jgi:pyruvate dehydrogenase complex dehydrogenase (E1) component
MIGMAQDGLAAFEPAFAESARRRHTAARIPLPAIIPTPAGEKLSTQESFGRILAALARDGGELAERMVTASPDVTVSTNLGGWVNRRGIFSRKAQEDTFKAEKVASFQRWAASPKGQHIELGIAENNLFILLAALGPRACCPSAPSTIPSSSADSMRSTMLAIRMRAFCWWRRPRVYRWHRRAALISPSRRR